MSGHTNSAAGPVVRGILLNGRRHRYLSWGDPGRPVVSLLHGRTAVVETWNRVAERLSDRFHVVALEQRGHGDSAWAEDGRYHLIDFLEDYETFADQVIPEPYLLVGHSMGSCTSLVYASRRPDRLRGLVLEDGGPPGKTVREAVRADHDRSPESFTSWEAAREHVAREYPHLHGDDLDTRVDTLVRPADSGRYTWRSDVHRLLGDSHLERDELFDTGQWQAVERLTVPTLFLWAARPPCLVEPEVIDRMAAMNPRITKVEIDSGHGIHEEAFEPFMEAVLPFLTERAGPGARGDGR
ncbi:pimeloyl-ACP methyl ester carboxylesterase [Streptosporangium becharense]|uniref:Pimeloyl-ACP methyl ester carboxylesterase n=1 Tax=Streptosporangium becharense TaxID=1816182 RepID=A0A7W9IBF4_9ACTN|nr:alpha/beta hydrolase [Streptosporangium becharense]MBB2914062.1 pimeloyl-ACP methyl ester carboxylesterase [Streptosporangium becharense]MBB5817089.1 pimeloyl-ACP methyl ester carboxylesterase [Streptosporangium becharense]